MLIKKSVKASAESVPAKIKSADRADIRLFFALWPDAAQQRLLHQLAKPYLKICGGRLMRVDTLHMTLLFLGNIKRHRLPELVKAAGRVRAPVVELELARFGCWRHNHIGFLAPAETPDALAGLAENLATELGTAGFEFDRRAFKAHVTVLRNMQNMIAAEPIAPMRWSVRSFVLVESLLSERGPSYRVLHSWPLVNAVVTSSPTFPPQASGKS